jgi:hypothetical protein
MRPDVVARVVKAVRSSTQFDMGVIGPDHAMIGLGPPKLAASLIHVLPQRGEPRAVAAVGPDELLSEGQIVH